MDGFSLAYMYLQDELWAAQGDEPGVILGIRRDRYPCWPGWDSVDGLADEAGLCSAAFRHMLRTDVLLAAQVKEHYRRECWDALGLRTLPPAMAVAVFVLSAQVGAGLAQRLVGRVMAGVGYSFERVITGLAALDVTAQRMVRKELLVQRIFFYSWANADAPAEVLARMRQLDEDLDILEMGGAPRGLPRDFLAA